MVNSLKSSKLALSFEVWAVRICSAHSEPRLFGLSALNPERETKDEKNRLGACRSMPAVIYFAFAGTVEAVPRWICMGNAVHPR